MQTNNKQREALAELVANIEMRASVFDIFSIIDRKTFLDARVALAEPVRNYEVGTAEEQARRLNEWCNGRHCINCRFKGGWPDECKLKWAQMPYESEVAK